MDKSIGLCRDPKGSAAIKVLAIITVVIVAAALFVGLTSFFRGENSVDFDLSTTSTTVDPGSDIEIVPQYGVPASAVKWTSGDESIATVTEEGKVTVKPDAQCGSAVTITAKLGSDMKPTNGHSMATVKSGSATCTLTVGDGSSSDGTAKIYNLKSAYRDYALINKDPDDGFSKGLLALSFNSEGNMVITLAGYDSSWKDKVYSFSGSATRDFGLISITLTAPNGDTYTNSPSDPDSIVPADPDSIEYMGPTLAVKHNELTYGKYDIVVEAHNCKDDLASASFDYMQGDGTLDSTGTVYRQYCWKYDGNTYSLTYGMNYGRYETFFAKNTADFEKLSNSFTARNTLRNDDILNVLSCGPEIADLAKELRTQYETKKQFSLDEDYANFVLCFVQVCFYYENDAFLHGELSNEMSDRTDYWAYSAETLYLGCGDCEDTSILAATLLIASGYSAGVTLFPGHAIASVALESYTADKHEYNLRDDVQEIDGKELHYYGCETTLDSFLKAGIVPVSIDEHDYSVTGDGDCKSGLYVSYNDKWYIFR